MWGNQCPKIYARGNVLRGTKKVDHNFLLSLRKRYIIFKSIHGEFYARSPYFFSNTSRTYPHLSTPSRLHILYKIQKPYIVMGMGPSIREQHPTKDHTLKENWQFIPQLLSAVNSSPVICIGPTFVHARMLTRMLTGLILCRSCLGNSICWFVSAVILYIQKTLFYSRAPYSLTFIIFPHPLLWCSRRPWCGDYFIYIIYI